MWGAAPSSAAHTFYHQGLSSGPGGIGADTKLSCAVGNLFCDFCCQLYVHTLFLGDELELVQGIIK